MRASVIIPVHNRAALTRQCLDTVFGDPSFGERYEVVVVDDGSTDETPQLLASYGERIRVARHDRATGFATACNDGAVAATGEDLVFLNNDTLPLKGWLDALVDYADSHPRAAAVGAKLLFPNDTVQHAGVTITEDLNPRHVYSGFPADHPAVNKSRTFPIVTAACVLFRRGPFEQAGGFDEAFSNGFEDVDLCLRLGEQGHEIHYCHESVAYHLEMGTRDFGNELPNLALYRRRWAHKVHSDAASVYIEDGLLSFGFNVRYPFTLKISPELALIDDGHEREADRLLAVRAGQVAELMRENIQLRLALTEAGVEAPDVQLTVPMVERPASPRAALFVSGLVGDSMRYRCEHHVEELESLGSSADAQWLEVVPLGDFIDTYGCFVLHRVRNDRHITGFVKEARRRQKPVIVDVDELLFESPDVPILEHVAIPTSDRGVYRRELREHAELIAAADAVFVPTEPLAMYARKLNGHVFVIPNAASDEMVRLSDHALAAVRLNGDRKGDVRVAYFSGSPMPARDFLEAADAVLLALEKHPAVRFLVVGNLKLDERFDRFEGRIDRLPVLPWRRLPPVIAKTDVNLAPLERNNPIAEAKSCVKWIEAALVSVPTVASPRDDFARAIRPGENGLLADAPDEWASALDELIVSADHRRSIGRAAYDDVRRRYTTRAQASRLYDAFVEVSRGTVERKLSINWLVGSTLDARQHDEKLLAELAWRGHHVRMLTPGGSGVIRGVEVQELPPAARLLPRADVTIATDLQTAQIAASGSGALFRLYLLDTADDAAEVDGLKLRYLCVGVAAAARLPDGQRRDAVVLEAPLQAERLERALLDLCFSRLDPALPTVSV